ncbi:microcystin-dependent protein [Microterricola gilva]|uniref:Microcystin-dependent protein n=1 Tax=Microterricola gilva TaxID=393267 RepID=A0A4Q8AII3_9MICO|nr:tail fiber protein [Microterricola gilva]RZU63741.1 microcystin-dependent protein [Microterricola gilva]
MAQPYVGEIRMFAGNFAPAGWMFCDGQLLPISENETLFNLIGTTYGGDGQSTFALPNMQGRLPLHQSSGGHILAETGGAEEVTLSSQQIPAHRHPTLAAAASGTSASPQGNVLATWADTPYATTPVAPAPGAPVALSPTAVAATGGNQPHDNMPPFLAVSFIISLFGLFPSQT